MFVQQLSDDKFDAMLATITQIDLLPMYRSNKPGQNSELLSAAIILGIMWHMWPCARSYRLVNSLLSLQDSERLQSSLSVIPTR